MNGKGRKLFRSAVGILTSVMMMGAYTTTAMASGIGVIDAKDMLDGYRLKIWSRQRFPTKRLLQPMSR